MSRQDARGLAITGATPAALEAFERALSLFQDWRTGAEAEILHAYAEAPSFTMLHVLHAYLDLCGRDPSRVRKARHAFLRASALPANNREGLHLAAIGAVLADDYEAAKATLSEILRAHPRDVLALQVAHAFDYTTGDMERLGDRVASVQHAWSEALPGYTAVLSMHAFSLAESGSYGQATEAAMRALSLNARDARACHAIAHVHEMTGEVADGIRWLESSAGTWAHGSVVATHLWWHLALFHLSRCDIDAALAMYDRRMLPSPSSELPDLIDASALLWRIELAGGDAGSRWRALADAWAPRLRDGFCSFNDLHAMLAFAGAKDWERCRELERFLAWCEQSATRHGDTTRVVGLPACRAIAAFGRGDYGRAVELLGALPSWVRRIGGSQAQRDILYLTLMGAVERLRRPRLRMAA